MTTFAIATVRARDRSMIWIVEFKPGKLRYQPVGPWWVTRAEAEIHLKKRQADLPDTKYRVSAYSRLRKTRGRSERM